MVMHHIKSVMADIYSVVMVNHNMKNVLVALQNLR